jgi:hypothetical protein
MDGGHEVVAAMICEDRAPRSEIAVALENSHHVWGY